MSHFSPAQSGQLRPISVPAEQRQAEAEAEPAAEPRAWRRDPLHDDYPLSRFLVFFAVP
jgi:hypothetical protein